MNDEAIKPCPNAECDNDNYPPFRDKGKGVIICADCYMEANEGNWNVLPRREEFYADLAALAAQCREHGDYLRTMDVPKEARLPQAVHYTGVMATATCAKMIDDLAVKYAPAEEG